LRAYREARGGRMGATVRLEKGLESKLERLPKDERGPRRELISGLAQFVVSVDSSERLGKLAEALESLPKVGEEGVPKEVALEAARMRNLVRVLQDRARLREESFRTGEVEDLLVVGRERLRQMRERGEILGVVRGERRPTLYPRWQFGADGEILEGRPDVISAAQEVGMGPEELHFFMTEPDERLGGEPPVDLLRRGETERVVDLLLSAGLGPF
jgi:hypothetical protein